MIPGTQVQGKHVASRSVRRRPTNYDCCTFTHVRMSKAQVVEWSILIGNDYTGTFDRSLFDLDGIQWDFYEWDDGLPTGHRTVDLESLRQFILDQHETFHLTSIRSVELQRAIEFSRANCSLQDLSCFLKEGMDSNDEDNDDIMKLSMDQRYEVQAFFDTYPIGAIAPSVLAFLRSSPLTVTATPVQLEALDKMLQRLPVQMHGPNGATSCNNDRVIVSESTILPQWDDIHIAHIYQLICKELLGPLSDRIPSTWRGLTKSPHLMFDGKIFHSLMYNARHTSTNDRLQVPNAMSIIAAEVSDDDRLPIDLHRENILKVIHPSTIHLLIALK